MITEQTITDPKGYAEEYAPKVIPIIKAHGGRYVARTDQVTNLAGEAGPKRIVIIGFKLMDEIKKMQSSKEYTDLQPIRDRVYKVRQFAIRRAETRRVRSRARPSARELRALGLDPRCPSWTPRI